RAAPAQRAHPPGVRTIRRAARARRANPGRRRIVRQIAFDNPWWLMAAVAAVPLGVMALAAFRPMTRTRRGSAALARMVLFSLIALALAGASGIRRSDRMAVVVVADVSGSVLRYGPAADGQDGAATLSMRRFVESVGAARGDEDLLGVLAF